MAYIHHEICHKYRKSFMAVNNDYTCNDYTCNDCFKVEETKKYKKYMIEIREGKTIEQRIEQIEDWIYANKNKIGNDNEILY